MAINGCINGLMAGLVALVLLPAQYYLPFLPLYRSVPSVELSPAPRPTHKILPQPAPANDHNLYLTTGLILLTAIVYLYDWIQRKLLERRLQKINHYLHESLERLRAQDARQAQLEATLCMAQNATSEYNLLLYLLLRYHKLGPPARKPPSPYFDEQPYDLLYADDENYAASLL